MTWTHACYHIRRELPEGEDCSVCGTQSRSLPSPQQDPPPKETTMTAAKFVGAKLYRTGTAGRRSCAGCVALEPEGLAGGLCAKLRGAEVTKSGYACDGFIWHEAAAPEAPSALVEQVGGDHYKAVAIQPVEYIHANGLGFCEGNVVKYVTRWKLKGGADDLRKARRYLDLLLALEAKR